MHNMSDFSLVMAISSSKHAGKWSLKTHTLFVHQGLLFCLIDPSQLTPLFTLHPVIFGSLLFVYFFSNYVSPFCYFFVVIHLYLLIVGVESYCCTSLHMTHTHTCACCLSLSQWDCSGWVISPMQRHLPDNTQHSQ